MRLTGSLPGLIGARELLVSLPQGATVSILLNALSGAYPVVDVMGPNMLIAVDGESVAPAVLLHDGQVVDLVMPMAGG